MQPVPLIKGVRFDHNLCSCYHYIAMFAIFVPNFLSSSNLRLRKCHSFLTRFLFPLVRTPMYMTLADDNYAVRVAYVRATGERPGGVSLLTRPRHQVERALAQARTKKQD